MEGKADGTAPSTLVFALASRASSTRRTGMAEESGMVFESENMMQNAPFGFNCQKAAANDAWLLT
jgi:hypothetical protein